MTLPPRRGSTGDGTSTSRRRSLEGLRVVVVDDDGDTRYLLTALLTERGALVFAAERAAGALALVQAEQPDLLISDIAMPEMDGYTLVGHVRSLPGESGGRTPAIAVTAHATVADRDRAIEAGFDAHVAKPVDVALLIDTVLAVRTGGVRASD